MTHQILFVDDERNILNSLKRSLHDMEYACHFAESGDEGLSMLKDHDISVIISDMRMPGMNGVEFLKKAHELCPDSIKIILSAYADINDIMAAINEGHIHSYVTKPWKDSRLRILIRNSCNYVEKIKREKELLIELEEKNSQLEKLNRNLEEIVAQRTLELKERNRLLQMLLEGKNIEEILLEGCKTISRLLNSRSVSIRINSRDKLLTEGNTTPKKILEHGEEKDKPTIINEYYIQNLSSKSRRLGQLSIHPFKRKDSELLLKIKNIIPIFEVLLLQDSYLMEAPEMIGSIDSLLGALDE